jgi:hypothetical protein
VPVVVDDAVPDDVGDAVPVADGVPVAVGVTSVAMSMPRTASARSPPAAASHEG